MMWKRRRRKRDLEVEIERLKEQVEQLYNLLEQEETRELPSIHFDRHLYQPLLIERGDKVKSEPPGLNDSERQFVEDMRAYCRAEKDKSLADKEVYLLRNLSRGKGIGFFDRRGFYPDFILWIKDASTQRIVFVEPHGMIHAEAYQHDDKARLHEDLPELAERIRRRTGVQNVELDSFIISVTSYEDLRKIYDDGTWDRNRFTKAHILFFEQSEEYDYLVYLMRGCCPE